MSKYSFTHALPFVPAYAPLSTSAPPPPPPPSSAKGKKRALPILSSEYKQPIIELTDQKTKKQLEAEKTYQKKKLKLSSAFIERNMKGDLVNMYQFFPESKDDKPLFAPPSAQKLHIHLPFQMVISGKTGSGKTTFLQNLSYALGCFDKIWLVVKDEDEYLYKKWIQEIRKEEDATGASILEVLRRPEQFEDITALNEKMRANDWHGLIIVDDMVNEPIKNMQQILNAWTLGRKGNLSTAYLTQKHYGCPMIIRDNIRYLVMGCLSNRNDCKRICSDIPQVDMEPEELQALHTHVMNSHHPGDPHNLLTLDLGATEKGLRYRKNFAPYSLFPPAHTS